MNKHQINELEKITNTISKELLSQNYDEANQIKFDKSLVINLLNLLNEVEKEQKIAIRWVPSQIGYKFNPDENVSDVLITSKPHKFFTMINGKEYSYCLSNDELLTNENLDDILHYVSEFLVNKSLLEEFKKDIAQYINIANHNAKLTQKTIL